MADASFDARPRSDEHHVLMSMPASLAMQNSHGKHCCDDVQHHLAMHIGQRIQALMKLRGIGTAAMAEHVGVSRGAVSNWFSTGRISKDNLVKAAQLLGVSAEALISGDVGERDVGPPFPPNTPLRTLRALDSDDEPNFPVIRRVRFKLSAGASGFGVEYLDNSSREPIAFRRHWYESRSYDPAKLFSISVCNGSMEPGLYDGDDVVVNTADTKPKDGEVFAFNYEGELIIKRLVRDEGHWWLVSDNPDKRRYPRKKCTEDVFIIGRIVHKQSERI